MKKSFLVLLVIIMMGVLVPMRVNAKGSSLSKVGSKTNVIEYDSGISDDNDLKNGIGWELEDVEDGLGKGTYHIGYTLDGTNVRKIDVTVSDPINEGHYTLNWGTSTPINADTFLLEATSGTNYLVVGECFKKIDKVTFTNGPKVYYNDELLEDDKFEIEEDAGYYIVEQRCSINVDTGKCTGQAYICLRPEEGYKFVKVPDAEVPEIIGITLTSELGAQPQIIESSSLFSRKGDLHIYVDVKEVHKVTFDTNGGKIDNSTDDIVCYLSKNDNLLEAPVKDGLQFLGWYTEPFGGTEVTKFTETEDVTYYAHWTSNTYYVSSSAPTTGKCGTMNHPYQNMVEFADYIKNGDSIVLVGDVENDSDIDYDSKDIYINLNGHTITFNDGNILNGENVSILIYSQNDMEKAIESNISNQNWKIMNDITLDKRITIEKSNFVLNINGNSHLIAGAEKGNKSVIKHMFNFVSKGSSQCEVNIKFMTIRSSDLFRSIINIQKGNNASKGMNVTLNTIALEHEIANAAGGAPIICNSSNLNLGGGVWIKLGENSWYAINLDAENGDANLDFDWNAWYSSERISDNRPVETQMKEPIIKFDNNEENTCTASGSFIESKVHAIVNENSKLTPKALLGYDYSRTFITDIDISLDYSKLDYSNVKNLAESISTSLSVTSNDPNFELNTEKIGICFKMGGGCQCLSIADIEWIVNSQDDELAEYKKLLNSVINEDGVIKPIFALYDEDAEDEDVKFYTLVPNPNISYNANSNPSISRYDEPDEDETAFFEDTNDIVILEYKSEIDIILNINIEEAKEETAKINGCDITFNTDGGTTINDISVEYGTIVNIPNPTRPNSTFNAWYDEIGNKIDLTKPVKKSMILTAKWLQNQTNTDETVIPTDNDEDNTTTKIQVTGDKDVKAGGLEEIAKEEKSNNATENVKVILTVESKTEKEIGKETETKAIKNEANTDKVDFLDIKVNKIIGTVESAIEDTGDNVIEVVIPYSLSGKNITGVYRYHDDDVEEITLDDTRFGKDGTYYHEDVYIHIFSTKFSTYAVSYSKVKEKSSNERNSYTVAKSSKSKYNLSVVNTPNGAVEVSDEKPLEDSTVTITVKPDEGYVVDNVKVNQKTGEEVEVTTKEIGKTYTFIMPSRNTEVTVTFKEVKNRFVDVPKDAYYYTSVNWALENNITSGIDETHFGPKVITTRAQMVTFLWKLAGSPEPTIKECKFTDVVSGSYYEKAVLWAVENGITHGTTTTTFSPKANIKRGQAVTLIHNYKGNEVVNGTNKFNDVKENTYYYNSVIWAVENGITSGTTADTFSPNEECTRAQVVTFLNNSFNK